jgi:hypothetical protein
MFKKCCVALVLFGFLCLNLGCPEKPVNGGRVEKKLPTNVDKGGDSPTKAEIEK